mgnify:FL=1
MNYANKLVLGTVQFGLDYGVNNQSGQVQQSEVNKILQLAKESGIKKIDTSSAYGTSESVLGKSLSENNLQFILSPNTLSPKIVLLPYLLLL